MVMEMVQVGWLPNWPLDTVLYGRNLINALMEETCSLLLLTKPGQPGQEAVDTNILGSNEPLE